MTAEPVPTLPHYLQPGLRLVFIGYNPAIYSAEAGHYYARPGNTFWRQLSQSGIAGRDVGPEDDQRLLAEAGIGFTDLCCRPTVRAEHLSREEIIEGSIRLHGELLQYQPLVACFSGRGIYQIYGRHALVLPARTRGRPYGDQPNASVSGPWVIPSSSGLASKWHRERLDWLRRLRDAVDPRSPAPDSC